MVGFQLFLESGKSLSLGRGCFELVKGGGIQEDKKKEKKENDLISILPQILLKFPKIFESQSSALLNKTACYFLPSPCFLGGKEGEPASLGIDSALESMMCCEEQKKVQGHSVSEGCSPGSSGSASSTISPAHTESP